MASYLVILWTIHKFRPACGNSCNCRLKSCVHYFVFRRSWFQIWRPDPVTSLWLSWISRYLLLGNYRIFSNIIRTSFCRFLKRKKKLVHGSNLHLSFNRPLRAAPSEVTRWVLAALKAILESIIVRSFKKCCISNAVDRSKDDILWEDDGVDKDDSDWVTDNDSVMSDDGESDE